MEIGTRNSCNNPCYLYNLTLTKKCPKCGGDVESDYENGYTIEEEWDKIKGRVKEVKIYNETKICENFKWNNKINPWHIEWKDFFGHYDQIDNGKTYHFSVNVNGTVEEYDFPAHYMMIEGENFYFPYGISMKVFFLINEYTFFPKTHHYDTQICLMYEKSNLCQLGKPIGYYGVNWLHMVNIYTCNLCGHRYHIIKCSSFAFCKE